MPRTLDNTLTTRKGVNMKDKKEPRRYVGFEKNFARSEQQLRKERLAREYRASHPTRDFSATNVITLVFAIILVFCVFRLLFGNRPPLTFESFLSVLEDAPVVDISPIMQRLNDKLTITADWGVFNFLRDFFNLFTGLMSFGTFVSVSMSNFIIYLTYFLRFLIGV